MSNKLPFLLLRLVRGWIGVLRARLAHSYSYLITTRRETIVMFIVEDDKYDKVDGGGASQLLNITENLSENAYRN